MVFWRHCSVAAFVLPLLNYCRSLLNFCKLEKNGSKLKGNPPIWRFIVRLTPFRSVRLLYLEGKHILQSLYQSSSHKCLQRTCGPCQLPYRPDRTVDIIMAKPQIHSQTKYRCIASSLFFFFSWGCSTSSLVN